MQVVLLLLLVATGCKATDPRADADIVLLVGAADEATHEEVLDEIAPWIASRTARGHEVATVPWYEVLDAVGERPTASAVRGWLRETFTDRATAEARPRYLGLIGPRDLGADVKPVLEHIPTFTHFLEALIKVDTTTSDLLYGFPHHPGDWEDGDRLEPAQLDVRRPTFLVFRVPAPDPASAGRFLRRSLEFEALPRRSDVALVAGRINLPSDKNPSHDSLRYQCGTAELLEPLPQVGRITKVFDWGDCGADFETTGRSHRLLHFLQGETWQGGLVSNISNVDEHGTKFYRGRFLYNLDVDDLDAMPRDKPNVFLAVNGWMDRPSKEGWNMTRVLLETGSVAILSSTDRTRIDFLEDIRIGQIDWVPDLFVPGRSVLQAFHGMRSHYYEELVMGRSADVKFWITVVVLGMTGDGTVTLVD